MAEEVDEYMMAVQLADEIADFKMEVNLGVRDTRCEVRGARIDMRELI